MDDFNCCLLQLVRFCIDTNLFLNQLYQFECQLTQVHSMNQVSSRKYVMVVERLSIIIKDLNVYYKNDFQKMYSSVSRSLLRRCYTIDEDADVCYEDFEHLEYFLRHEKKYYRRIFHYLHKLSIDCILCRQYRRVCTNSELESRFVHLRLDLFSNLEIIHEKIEFLWTKINENFQEQSTTNHSIIISEQITSHLFRTICCWSLVLLVFGLSLRYPIIDTNRSKTSWFS